MIFVLILVFHKLVATISGLSFEKASSATDLGSGSAAKSVLVGLDRIQTQALRVCLGAVRTLLVCALQIEAG